MKYVRFACAVFVIALMGYVLFPDWKAAAQQPAGQLLQPGNGLPPQFVPPAGGYQNTPQPGFGAKAPVAADPELSKLFTGEAQAEREAADLTRAYSRTDKEEERGKIKTKLAEALGKQFDWQQKRRDLELERLETQTKKVRDLMQKRSDALATIVEKRQDQLLREADGLGWTPPPGASRTQYAHAAGLPGVNYYPVPMGGTTAYADMRPGMGMGGADPETAKLLTEEGKAEQEAANLVKDYSHAEKDADRAKIKSKLTVVLEKQFDMQQKRRDLELTRLETQLKKLHDLMKKRGDARQTIVERRLDQILREADGLGWTAPPAPAAQPAQKFPGENFTPQVTR